MACMAHLTAALLLVAGPSPQREAITDVAEVVGLPPEAAAAHLPVRIRAVVTSADPARSHFFVQSGRHGISVWDPHPALTLRRGDLVELDGVTSAGTFAPKIVDPRGLRVVGRAPLPEAEPLRYQEFANGAYDARFLQLGGVVHAVRWEEERLELWMVSSYGRVRVLIPQPERKVPEELVGAAVVVRGAFGTDLNARGQFAGLRVHAQELADLRVVTPATPESDLPLRPLSRLGRYDPTARTLARVRTRGVVTYRRADGAFFVQDGGDVAVVRAWSTLVSVGDAVEVVGFTSMADGLVLIEDARVRPMPAPAALRPVEIASTDELASPALDGLLVRVRGEAHLATRRTAEVVITSRLQGEQGFLEVRLPIEEGAGLVATLEPGSMIAFTGVKLPLVSSSLGTRWPVVLARSAADVVVLRRPPFWTLARLSALALALLGLLLLGGLGIVWRGRVVRRTRALLEARVEKRTRDLAQANEQLLRLDVMRTQFVSMAAHDLRSPLGVILANAELLQASPGQAAPGAFAGACEDILVAGRRMQELLVGFLSRQRLEQRAFHAKLEPVDLRSCSGGLAGRMGAAARRKGQRLQLDLGAEPCVVHADPVLLAHVLDNLVDNALKFSPRGARVRVSLEARPDQAVASVEDEGPGLTDADRARLFEPHARLSARPTGGESSSGLGLSLVKRWVDAMGGTIWAESTPGRGACFRVAFPLRPPPGALAPVREA